MAKRLIIDVLEKEFQEGDILTDNVDFGDQYIVEKVEKSHTGFITYMALVREGINGPRHGYKKVGHVINKPNES